MLHKRFSLLLSILVTLSLLLTACGGAAEAPAAEAPAEEAAPTEAPAEAPAEEAAPTEAPAEEAEAPAEEAAGGDYMNAARNETVIFDIDGGRVTDPELWNPFVPGNRRDHGDPPRLHTSKMADRQQHEVGNEGPDRDHVGQRRPLLRESVEQEGADADRKRQCDGDAQRKVLQPSAIHLHPGPNGRGDEGKVRERVERFVPEARRGAFAIDVDETEPVHRSASSGPDHDVGRQRIGSDRAAPMGHGKDQHHDGETLMRQRAVEFDLA